MPIGLAKQIKAFASSFLNIPPQPDYPGLPFEAPSMLHFNQK